MGDQVRRSAAARGGGVEAVVFDLDGTLLNHDAAGAAGADAVARAIRIEPTEATRRLWFDLEREHFDRYRDGHIDLMEQRRRRMGGFVAATIDSALDDERHSRLWEVFFGAYEGAWVAYPDARQALLDVRGMGLAVGILTNGRREMQQAKLDRIGLADVCGPLVSTADDVGVHKPDPRAFAAAVEAVGATARTAIYIGDDLEADVQGGLRAGMRPVQVDHGAEESTNALVADPWGGGSWPTACCLADAVDLVRQVVQHSAG